MAIDPKLKTSRRRMWRFYGFGMAMLASGTALTILGTSGNSFTWYGWAGVVVLFTGVAVLLMAVQWAGRIEKKEEAGPAGRVEPNPSDDLAPVAWVTNSYPETMVRRERRWRLSLFVVVPWLVASWGLFILAPPFPDWLIGVTVGSAFLSIFPLIFGLSNGVHRDSRFAPARVGLSEQGVHAEFDRGRVSGQPLPSWTSAYVPWTDVTSVTAPAYRGSSHQLNFERVGGGKWVLNGLDPDIVAKVLHAWDTLPSLPLRSARA